MKAVQSRKRNMVTQRTKKASADKCLRPAPHRAKRRGERRRMFAAPVTNAPAFWTAAVLRRFRQGEWTWNWPGSERASSALGPCLGTMPWEHEPVAAAVMRPQPLSLPTSFRWERKFYLFVHFLISIP